MSRFAVSITALFVLMGTADCFAQASPTGGEVPSAQPAGLENDVQSRLLEEIAALRQQVSELQTSVSDVPRLRQEVRSLGEQVTLLSRSVNDLQDSGQLTNNVLGAMEQNEDVRRDVGALAQGKVIIYNDRDFDAPLYINGTRWSALRGRSYVFVPAGSVLFQEPHDLRPQLKDRNSWRLIDGELQMSYVIER
jgi:hypothetical protein